MMAKRTHQVSRPNIRPPLDVSRHSRGITTPRIRGEPLPFMEVGLIWSMALAVRIKIACVVVDVGHEQEICHAIVRNHLNSELTGVVGHGQDKNR